MDLATSHDSLGTLLGGQGERVKARERYATAVAILEKLSAEFPTVLEYRKRLGGCCCNIGHSLRDSGQSAASLDWFGRAINTLRGVYEQEPRNMSARQFLRNSHHGRAAAYGRLKRYAEAARDWEQVAALCADGERAWAHFQHGVVLDLAGARPPAEAALDRGLAVREQAVRDAPDDGRVPRWYLAIYLMDRGLIYLNTGRHEQAVPWFGRAAEAFGGYAAKWPAAEATHQLRWSHQNRAIALDRLGKPADAVRDWDKVIELCPKGEQPNARASRVTSRLSAGQVAEAVADADELRKLTDWNAGQWYHFARVYAVASGKIADKKGEYAAAAMELLIQAVKAGYKDVAHMKKDPDLDSLRGRDDFRKLLADLEAKFPPKREVLPAPRRE